MGGMTDADLQEFSAIDLSPADPVEMFFALVEKGPGAIGAAGYRKLKRRLQHRAEERFRQLSADLRPGDLALDLGANVGEVTAVLSATGAEVHAYEPEPETFTILKRRFADTPHVILHNAAVSNRSGAAELVLPASFTDRPRSASKAASIAHDVYRGPDAQTRTVPVLDIREILAGLPRPPRLIKMDIEGAELDVLDAIRRDNLLEPGMAVFVETHERIDPAALPQVRALQSWARTDAAGYVNLNWG